MRSASLRSKIFLFLSATSALSSLSLRIFSSSVSTLTTASTREARARRSAFSSSRCLMASRRNSSRSRSFFSLRSFSLRSFSFLASLSCFSASVASLCLIQRLSFTMIVSLVSSS